MYGEWEKGWASSTLALVGCFRVTSRDSLKWRACSRANPRPTPRPEEKITQPLSQGPLISGRERTLGTRGWIVLPQEIITQNEQLTFTAQCFHRLVYFYASLYRTFSSGNGSPAMSVRIEIRSLWYEKEKLPILKRSKKTIFRSVGFADWFARL